MSKKPVICEKRHNRVLPIIIALISLVVSVAFIVARAAMHQAQEDKWAEYDEYGLM